MDAAKRYNKVSTSQISNNIAFSILSELPLKSIKRFTSVQKSWSLLLQNSHFMNMLHTNFFISKHDDEEDNNTCLLLKERIRTIEFRNHDTLYTLSTDRFEDKIRLDWPPPFQEDDAYIDILGYSSVNGVICIYQGVGNDAYIDILGYSSVNGVICIYQGVGNDATTILWNPATGEFKIVPPSLQPYENFEFNLCPDLFGYDNVRDDYKVIRNASYPIDFEGNWVYVPDKDSCYWEGHDDDSFWEEQIVETYDSFWEIYSLKNNSWSKLDVADMPIPWPCNSQMTLNDMCHWLGFENYKMWSFDFTNEKLFATSLPSYLEFDGMHTWIQKNLLMLNGCVAFMCNYVEMNSFHIWILGEFGIKESWTKLFVVGPLTCVRHSIGAGKKNDIFFIKKDDKLARFNLSTQEFEEIEFMVGQIVIYKEVLLSIEGMNN